MSMFDEIANDSSAGQTCLSTDSHELAIRNYVLHYFGCLKFAARDRFFDPMNPRWHLYSGLWDVSSANQGEAEQDPDAYRRSWESICLAELEFVARLRNTLAEDSEERHLVDHLIASRAECLPSLRENARNRGVGSFAFSNEPENNYQQNNRPTPVEAFVEASLMFF
ncbi:hypothetical protein PG997_010269 [Apiospora hydei]|uniref:Uncharacterized protein n=1 Tax=Apiospora hydei TaxID=1337664 RepID=A0ABR1VZ40_9PEZI